MIYLLAGAFLAAATAANLVIAHVGPEAAPYVALGLVGLALALRDTLDDRLRPGQRLAVIGGLVAAGAALAYITAPDAGRIALASAAAFAAALTVDAAVYALARRRPFLERSGLSNAAAAPVDSAVFFLVAFGTLDGAYNQATAKLAGATLAALALNRLRP